jgi:hypothetical protein
MKRSLINVRLGWLLALAAMHIQAQDIAFTNKTAAFTNLQGKIFEEVQIIRGDWDGIVWREGVSGGRVTYTNLHPCFLQAWGIPTNRIGIARARAERKAVSDAQYRAARQFQAQWDLLAREKQADQEAAAAPLRARAEQMKADAEAIAALAQQIEQAKMQLRRAEAAAHDYNNANRYNKYAPTLYVKQSERVKIEEAEIRLKKMKAAFAREYKTRP